MTTAPPPAPPASGWGEERAIYAPATPLPLAGGAGGGPVGQFKPRNTTRAKDLRNHATPAERQLWRAISRRQIGGHKFSRQMPIGPYFADFLCREAKLLIELDGYSHDQEQGRDERRDCFLAEQGFRVLRFANREVMDNLEGVVQAIRLALAETSPPPAPPASGRGEEGTALVFSHNVDIREVSPADAPDAADLLNAIIAQGGTTALEEAFTPEQLRSAYLDGPTVLCCFVAVDPATGTVEGFQTLGRYPELPADIGDIGTFARIGSKQRGIGTALFGATQARARALGLNAINATIRADNVGGLAFYAKLGFDDHSITKAVPLANGTLVDRINKRFLLTPSRNGE